MGFVLIVEDDTSMSIALRDGLKLEGHTVMVANDGEEGLSLARRERPDIMILDVMLPELSGFDVCKALREEGNILPIIMLTARGQELDRVNGLKSGADDYVTKPFSFAELAARVEAVLRRQGGPSEPDVYQFGEIAIDFVRMTGTRGGAGLDLSPRELKLLRYFILHRGEVVTRDDLLSAVWGYNSTPITRTVDMHVAKLRRKIECDPLHPAYLVTVHGAGYRFLG